MNKLATYLFLLSMGLYSIAQSTEELRSIENILLDIWGNTKSIYEKKLNSLNNKNTDGLYYTQSQTNNLLRYAFNQKNYEVLNQLAEVYLIAYDKLDSVTFKKVGRYCSVTFSDPQPLWLAGENSEVVLNSAQFLYVISQTIHYASVVPADTLVKYASIKTLVDKYVPVLKSHYTRWLTTDRSFQVDAWPYCIQGCFDRQKFLEIKLQRGLGDTLFCNVVTDEDMWIVTGITELVSANFENPDLVPINQGEMDLYKNHIEIGTQLFKSRLESNTTNLIDLNGNSVVGLVFDPDQWISHPDYLYAGIEDNTCPPQELSSALGVSWDISHSKRWVHVFETLFLNRHITGQSFPNINTMRQLSNQFLYRVFNKDLSKPLFTNYFNGTNGWYRFEYLKREGFGYAPYDQSISAVTGGYCFWSLYNSDFALLRKSLWEMIKSSDSLVLEHVANHYGTYYSKCERTYIRDFDQENAFTHSVDLLQFLPTFFTSDIHPLANQN